MTSISTRFGNTGLFIRENNNGFTLIEVLLAIFIFAVVISLIFTAYTGSIRIMADTDVQAEITRQAGIALERMTEDLESIFLSAWLKPDKLGGSPVLSGRFLGEKDEIDGLRADRIRFLSRARVIFDEQRYGVGVAEIAYYLKKDEEEESLILYRSETQVLEASPEEGTGGLEVCRGLRSMEITYLNGDNQTVEEWDSASAENKYQMPGIVTITLFWGDRSGRDEMVYPFRTSTVLPLWRGKNAQAP